MKTKEAKSLINERIKKIQSDIVWKKSRILEYFKKEFVPYLKMAREHLDDIEALEIELKSLLEEK